MTSFRTVAVASALVCLASVAMAQSTDPPRAPAAKERWESMSEADKAAARERLKSRWESMTPEQKAAAKKRFTERHPEAAARLAARNHPPAPNAGSAAASAPPAR
jgi:hypothetical protein